MSDIGEMVPASDAAARLNGPTALPSRRSGAVRAALASFPPPPPRVKVPAASAFVAPAQDAPLQDEKTRDKVVDHGDAMNPARGIAVGLLLVTPFWAAVGYAIHLLMR